MYGFAKVTIYLGFAFYFTVTNFDILKLTIDYQVDHQLFETGVTGQIYSLPKYTQGIIWHMIIFQTVPTHKG